MTNEPKRLDPEVKKLVLWRLELGIPPHFKLSIGNKGTFTKEEMKQHVEIEDGIGKEIVDMLLEFLRALSSGKLSKVLAE